MPRVRIDNNCLCVACRDPSFDEVTNPFVFCDMKKDGQVCNQGWHLYCAGDTEVPEGPWACPGCRVPGDGGGGPAPGNRPTFHLGAPPPSDKSELRRQAGLGGTAVATVLEGYALLEGADAPRTKLKYDRVERLFREVVGESELAGQELDLRALLVYVTTRVKRGIAAVTTSQEAGIILNRFPQIKLSPQELDKMYRGIARFANTPGRAKMPISLEDLAKLRDAIQRQTFHERWAENPEVCEHYKARDWCFFLLAFLGFFRGDELVNLLWSDLRLLWNSSPSTTQIHRLEGLASEVVFSRRGETPHALKVHVRQSKTDQGALGADVLITAGKDATCIIKVVQRLWEHRREGQVHVFAEVRPDKQPTKLSTDTFRNRLKTYAATFMTAEEVEQLGLHSFRKGGASAAKELGTDLDAIRLHGRWSLSSNVVRRYALTADQATLDLGGRFLDRLPQ